VEDFGINATCRPEDECEALGGQVDSVYFCPGRNNACCIGAAEPCPVEEEGFSCVSELVCNARSGTPIRELVCERGEMVCCDTN
jgi:hypothetical protein